MTEQARWPAGWDLSALPPCPEEDCRRVDAAARAVCGGAHRADFSAACRAFYLYRWLHRHGEGAQAVLLGDYYFSLFSRRLIPLDSVALTEAFSDYLAASTQEPLTLADYLTFIEGLKGVTDA